MKRDLDTDVTETATKAIAAASKTPFRTAFKITMGIMFAQTLGTLLGLATIAGLILAVGYAVKHF